MPVSVIGPEPMFAAPSMQYMPDGYTLFAYWTLDPRSIAPGGNVNVQDIESAIEDDGTTILTEEPVVTVPPNAMTLPEICVPFPIVTPDASRMVPAKLLFAPSVVALVGTQDMSDTFAPSASVTLVFATVVSAPLILNM